MNDEIIFYKKKKFKALDLILFVFLSLFLPFLSLGNLSFENGKGNFFLGFSVDFSKPLNSSLAIPIILLFLSFTAIILFRNRRVERFERSWKKDILWMLFIIFLLSRGLSTFLFPYGEAEFIFHSSAYRDTIVTIAYKFPIEDRILCFAMDVCFALYFIILFGYLPKKTVFFRFAVTALQCILILLALSAIIYSCIVEQQLFKDNLLTLFGFEDRLIIPLKSFTQQKNVFGFILTLGAFSSILLFVQRPNPVSPLLATLFFLTTFLCDSRTSIALCLLAIVAFLVFYPLFCFSRHRIYSSIFLGIDICLIVVFAIVFTIGNQSTFHSIIVDAINDFFNMRTMNSRFNLTKNALETMNSPFVNFFGYGRVPFNNIIVSYRKAIGAPELLLTSHNGLVDIYCHFGYIGIALSVLVILYLFYTIFRQFQYEKKEYAALYLCLLVLFLLHFFSEPRFFTLDEGSTILLLGAFVFPCLRDYQDHVLKEA